MRILSDDIFESIFFTKKKRGKKMEEQDTDFSTQFPQDDRTTAHLYEVVEGKYEQVAKYEYVPDGDKIGKMYGGGSYRLIIRYYDATTEKIATTTRNFTLSKHYNKQPIQPQNLAHPQQSEPQIMPILLALLEQSKNPIVPNLGGIIESAFGSSVRMLEENLKKQQNIFGTLYKTMIPQPPQKTTEYYDDYEESDEEENMNSPMVSLAWTMVKGFIPQLINGGISDDVINTIKSSPIYAGIIANEKAKKEFEYLIYENFGIDALQIAKRVLGL